VWLVACQDADFDASAAGERLRSLGLAPLELVKASELVHGAGWEHRVDSRRAWTRLTLADGRVIDSDDVQGVLNRLLWVSAEGYAGASEADREYAGGELYALVQSWLASLGRRVINRPTGSGLAGAWRTPCQWRSVAREAGLAIRPYSDEDGAPCDGRRVLVIDERIVGDDAVPDDVRSGCGRLARMVDLDLVEACFDEDWSFADASLLPAIASPADGRVDAVAEALRARAA
jgi:hypothetical protein